MVRPGTPPEELVAAVAGGQSVLVLGPGVAHGVAALEWAPALEAMRGLLPDASGWEAYSLGERLQLLAEGLGRERLEVEVARHLPSVEALGAHVADVHRALLGLPVDAIVTTTPDGLVDAALETQDAPVRVLADDDDAERAHAVHDGARLLVKLAGDLLGETPAVLTPEDFRELPKRRPALLSTVRRLVHDRVVVAYGLGLDDPYFTLLLELRPSRVYALVRDANTLTAQIWARRGVQLVGANTWAELERWVEALRRESTRRRRGRTRLDAALAEGLPDHDAGIRAAAAEAQSVLLRRLSALEPFRWLRATPGQLESWVDDAEMLPAALRVLHALAHEGQPVPASAFATLADLLMRAGQPELAREAVDAALRLAFRGSRAPEAALRSLLGRTLCRLGELERARPLLSRALAEGNADEPAARTAELAWLCRCVLERVEDLRDRQRERAALELLGRFLVTFAPHFALARPAEGAPRLPEGAEGEGWRWSLYYANFRLGRLFALASELAGQSGAVYAQQAVELLARAIEMNPGKPEPYRALRPLLLSPRGARPDKLRWERLVTQAPPEVRRKLDELEAQESRSRPRR